MKIKINITGLGYIAALLCLPQLLQAHGYVSSPESRSLLCHERVNSNCGPIQWEPQSVEGLDRFPETGPADGEIASAGLEQFSQLNEQTISRWSKVDIASGQQSFSWRFTANHASRDWRYYITKTNWNPNQPLTRASFDLSPFCTVDGNYERPPKQMTHQCYVPERNGYHVILSVWDVGDTVNSFYQVIDVMFAGDQPPPEWNDIGDINPVMDLQIGDSVGARFFSEQGEQTDLRVDTIIETAQQGDKNSWPKQLAEAVNRTHSHLKAGIKNNNGDIVPSNGKNDVFAAVGSNIVRAEIEISPATQQPEFTVTGLASSYDIENGSATLSFEVHPETASADNVISLSAVLYNSSNAEVVSDTAEATSSHSFTLTAQAVEAGDYTLVIIAENSDGQREQQSFALVLTEVGDQPFDFVYPQNIEQYEAGTRVKASDGSIYQCKPYPYDGWCRVYSPNANHYEPGVGSHWQDAWVKL